MAEFREGHDSEVIGRRSARLSLIAPVILRGADAEGKPFKENTWTISVNKHGARLSTFYRLKVGDDVTMENPIYGRTAKGRVVRANEKHYPEDPYEISVELTEPTNVWGVKFPPEDWQKEGWPAVGRKYTGKGPAFGMASKPEAVATCSASAKSGFPLQPTRRFPDPPGFSPDAFRHNAYGPAVARRCGISAAEDSQAPSSDGETRPAPAGDSGILSAVQEATRQLEEKQKAFQSLAAELEALAERLDSSRSELQTLVTTTEAQQRGLNISKEGNPPESVEAQRIELERTTEEVREKLQKEADLISSRFLHEAETGLQERTRGALEELNNTSADRFASLQDEQARRFGELLETSRAQAIEDAKREIAKAAREAEASLAMTRAAVESFSQEARKIREDFRGEVNKARQDYRETIQREIGALAKEAVEEQRAALQEHVRSQIDKLGEEAFNHVRSRFEQISQETCDDLHKHVGVAAVTFKNLTDKSKELFEDSFQKSLEAFRERIDSFSKTVLDQLQADAKLVTNDVRIRLRRAANALDGEAGAESGGSGTNQIEQR